MILSRGKSEQVSGTGTGVTVIPVVVCDQDGRGGMIDNRAKQQFEFPGTVFRKPTGSLRF